MNKFQKLPHLLSGNRLPGHAVVNYHCGKFKAKWVFAENVIIQRHLKGRPQHAPDCLDNAVPSVILLKLILRNHLRPKSCLGKSSFRQKGLHKFIIREGVRLHTHFR